MQIKLEYRRAAIPALNEVWRHKVFKSSFPSYRLWGLVLRHKWLHSEFRNPRLLAAPKL